MRALALSLLSLLMGCQCVLLPANLRCTDEGCAPGESCGEDGRCVPLPTQDAGCEPVRSCLSEGRTCGLLSTGCDEVDCGACGLGQTCGVLQPGQCATCELTAFDAPDPDFVDNNCDGIDGTVDGGLFLDPVGGSDLAPGTRAAPLKTLARAALLTSQAPSFHTVFIAEGTLAGQTWRNPVSLAGGYRAGSWSRSNTVTTLISGSGVGLRVEDVPAPVRFSRLTIEATPDDAGTPTIGLVLVRSPLTLQGVVVRAGEGPPGLPGRAGAAGSPGGLGLPGNLGSSGDACPTERLCFNFEPISVEGGGGGSGPCGAGFGGDATGFVTFAPGPTDAVLQRDLSDECSGCPCPLGLGSVVLSAMDGVTGTGGKAGDGGSDAPPSSLMTTGWVDAGLWFAESSAAGTDGQDGKGALGGLAGGNTRYEVLDGGQPDGGGLLSIALGSSGGGGGAPGCGGRAGEGGAQGGPSLGLLVLSGAPRFEGVEVFSGRGGMGGQAGAGGLGGAGGDGGPGGPRWEAECQSARSFRLLTPRTSPTGIRSGFFSGAGGAGGLGGAGGKGGDGAPGAGGPSVGVWCEGVQLAVLPTITLGAGGPGAVRADGAQGLRGPSLSTINCQ